MFIVIEKMFIVIVEEKSLTLYQQLTKYLLNLWVLYQIMQLHNLFSIMKK